MTTDEKIDKLTEITAKGFEEVGARFDKVQSRLDNFENKSETFQHENWKNLDQCEKKCVMVLRCSNVSWSNQIEEILRILMPSRSMWQHCENNKGADVRLSERM